jgi:hypothetical protein
MHGLIDALREEASLGERGGRRRKRQKESVYERTFYVPKTVSILCVVYSHSPFL